MSKKPRELIQSVEKAVHILDILASSKGSISLADLSKQSELSKSTVHRLLVTLVYCGLVEQDQETRQYMLGLRLFELGNAVPWRFDHKIVHGYLDELNQLTKETIHLGILEQGEIVYVDKVESKETIRMHSRLGARVPFYCTSLGKVLVAHLNDEELKNVLEETELHRFTEQTITNPAILRVHLALVKNQGYAVDDQEHEQHITCIGGPIFDHAGKAIAAFSVSGPTFRMTARRLTELKPVVKSYSKKMSALYGYGSTKSL